MMKRLICWSMVSMISLAGFGCASRGYVDQTLNSEIGELRSEINSVRQDVVSTQADVVKLKTDAEMQQERLDKELQLVRDALDRAEEAHRLAKGKLMYQVTISDASVPFAYRKAELSADAKAALDSFATELIGADADVYIEIQGHTDRTGSEAYNQRLGLSRADSVRRYLYETFRLPLHRMSTYSYGELQPVASNDTPEGRAENRRVVLLVME